mmetsp:Transcript_8951/g.30817  ORF Transcript_8951/g.30817 Transcript_8951/m.30817 type:complete len:189 (+) Transcript_8951:474-1040(+)
MRLGALHVFSVPDHTALLRRHAPCLHFEHTALLREEHVDALLVEFGFEVLDKAHFGGGHSIFYAARLHQRLPDRALSGGPAPVGALDTVALAFAWRDALFRDAATSLGHLARDPASNFLYAAHVGTQYLLAAGLGEFRFRAVLDNDPAKVGKRLYGTSLHVLRPESIRGLESPVVVLRQGAYDAEISR